MKIIFLLMNKIYHDFIVGSTFFLYDENMFCIRELGLSINPVLYFCRGGREEVDETYRTYS
ncbi:hypothetical protein GCM10008014_47550 [Paenibacillus silvae]|uniref:Uncharacterized protein n=1 Tax=Paenibacillus silvae TaxID=1325358 RepID=A0ABQ1ZIK7_9BACL|nr:hypothetical protein GCM10008014_47550 [Paenibacillus silvae]